VVLGTSLGTHLELGDFGNFMGTYQKQKNPLLPVPLPTPQKNLKGEQ